MPLFLAASAVLFLSPPFSSAPLLTLFSFAIHSPFLPRIKQFRNHFGDFEDFDKRELRARETGAVMEAAVRDLSRAVLIGQQAAIPHNPLFSVI